MSSRSSLWYSMVPKKCVAHRAILCGTLCFFPKTDVISFDRYDVVEGDSTPLLNIDGRYALDVGDGGYFRRYSTLPTQDADTDLRETIAAGTCVTSWERSGSQFCVGIKTKICFRASRETSSHLARA